MKIIKWVVAACIGIASFAAAAQPQRCSAGYIDASCGNVLLNAAQAPKACSTAPGWRTDSPSVWIGSQYSTPTCSYTANPSCPTNKVQTTAPSWNGSAWTGMVCSDPPAAPTCPPGFDQTTAPSWNGSAWVGLACAPSAPRGPAPGLVTMASNGFGASSCARSGFAVTPSLTFSGRNIAGWGFDTNSGCMGGPPTTKLNQVSAPWLVAAGNPADYEVLLTITSWQAAQGMSNEDVGAYDPSAYAAGPFGQWVAADSSPSFSGSAYLLYGTITVRDKVTHTTQGTVPFSIQKWDFGF